ncbi:MAG: hypothetical protein KDM63_08905, partial [Verrucomicrobiae bacterium]|nr:hypothetical protein [Verrucomicrobiae bacterium]
MPDLENVRFQPLAAVRELPPVSVNQMVVDAKGGLWLGTDSGLWRFEKNGMGVLLSGGDRFSSLQGSQITALAADSDDEIWVGTGGGKLFRFDLSDSGASDPVDVGMLPGKKILCLQFDLKGDLWIGTEQGLARWGVEEGKLERFDAETGGSRVSALAMSAEGKIWAGLFDGRLLVQRRGEKSPAVVWQSAAPVTSLAAGTGAGLWIGTQGAGLFRFDPATNSVEAGTGIPGCDVAGRMIDSLYQDSIGHLWVSSHRGMARIDTKRQRATIYRHDPADSGSVPGHEISALCEDRTGGLWLAAKEGGVSRLVLKGFGFRHVKVEGGRVSSAGGNGAVWGFSENEDGSVWVGSDSGLHRWNAEQGWLPSPMAFPGRTSGESGLPFVQVLSRDSAGVLWMGTRGDGLFRLGSDGQLTQVKREADSAGGLPHNSVSAIAEDSQKRLWIGTMGGGVARVMASGGGIGFLAALTDKSKAGDSAEGGDLADCRHVTALVTDKGGRTWVGSLEGLFLLDTELGKLVHYRSLEMVTPGELRSDSVSCLFSDSRGLLWVGSMGHGVDCFDPASGEVSHFSRATSGLPDDRIASIQEDELGNLWFGTGNGVGCLDPTTGSVRRFGELEGIQRGMFHASAAVRLKTGSLLMGGADGFNIINPDRLPPERTSAPPVLLGLELSGAPVLPTPDGVLEAPLAETERLR